MDAANAYAPLISRIEQLLEQKSRVIIAIDGMAASGKTTLASALSSHFEDSAVVHMDDFTIPFEDRTPDYFDRLLSNADIARFDREVLSPLLSGTDAVYRPYICHPVPGFLAPVRVRADVHLVIVEGAYCLHDQLFDRYDLTVLSLIDPSIQQERILRRNGANQLERFVSTWIPMENRHIAARNLRARCNEILFTDQAP